MSKLVRDLIPEIIEKNDGVTPKVTVASGQELEDKVREKVIEEIGELLSAPDGEILGEAADVLEIVAKVVAIRMGISSPEALVRIESARREKLEKRGGFERNIVWHPKK